MRVSKFITATFGCLLFLTATTVADETFAENLAEIKAQPGFVAFQEQRSQWLWPSSARTSAEFDAPYAYAWVGYVESVACNGETTWLVYDTSGNHVTMVDHSGYWCEPMPAWVDPAMNYLEENYFIPSTAYSGELDLFRLPALDTDEKLLELELIYQQTDEESSPE